jgi:hypothetical protein
MIFVVRVHADAETERQRRLTGTRLGAPFGILSLAKERGARTLQRISALHILFYMKQLLIEIDDQCAKDLERVAPAAKRVRAEFIRRAIQHAVDVALDRDTERAYRIHPLDGAVSETDLLGWDAHNEFRGPSVGRDRGPAVIRSELGGTRSSPRSGSSVQRTKAAKASSGKRRDLGVTGKRGGDRRKGRAA